MAREMPRTWRARVRVRLARCGAVEIAAVAWGGRAGGAGPTTLTREPFPTEDDCRGR